PGHEALNQLAVIDAEQFWCGVHWDRKSTRHAGAKGFRTFLEELDHPYWRRHWNLRAAELPKPVALIGGDRITDLLINAFLPSQPIEIARAELERLRGPYPSGRLLRASQWIVGTEAPELMRTARDQQGLLQLFTDFSSTSPLEAASRILKTP
ncbi:MAG: hypothetical protein ACKOEZ_11540, partial [Spartobacteria bacterium]